MAHYECSNCGASMGIDFGFCKNCTPKEYFIIKEELKDIIYETETKVKNISENSELNCMKNY